MHHQAPVTCGHGTPGLTAPTDGTLLVVDWLAAGKDAKATASKAAKAVKKNIKKKSLKPRYSVVFHRPKTLKRTRDPKYTKKRCVHAAGYSSFCCRVT